MIPPTLPLRSSLPTPQSTASFWHQDPSKKLTGHRTTKDLPTDADVVVIGSGITGAFAAREMLQTDGFEGNVVMLEAREACWGATGRNGGHCQPLLTMSPPSIGQFELDTFNYLNDLISQNNISCDWKVVGGVHPLATDDMVAQVKQHLHTLQEQAPHLAGLCTLYQDRADLERLRLLRPDQTGVKAALVQKCAAKCWPYKLVAWVLEDLLSRYASSSGGGRFNLQTNTPVVKLQRLSGGGGDGKGGWMVHTQRGQIFTSKVLLATNAYTSFLLPQFSGVIVPVRGQVAALTPPPESALLEHSYDFVSGQSEDYLIHRDDGRLILGGERLSSETREVGISDDAGVNGNISRALKTALGQHLRLSLDGRDEQRELDAEFEWTGIMGYSSDGLPWVGEVSTEMGGDGDGGLWLAAGYTGHGMPVAARCGMAVAQRMLGVQNGIELPEQWAFRRKQCVDNDWVGMDDFCSG